MMGFQMMQNSNNFDKVSISAELPTLKIEDIEFLGILKKNILKIQRSIKKEVEIPDVSMKNSWNFHWSWFLTLEFPPATRAGFPLSQGGQGKSGKLEIF